MAISTPRHEQQPHERICLFRSALGLRRQRSSFHVLPANIRAAPFGNGFANQLPQPDAGTGDVGPKSELICRHYWLCCRPGPTNSSMSHSMKVVLASLHRSRFGVACSLQRYPKFSPSPPPSWYGSNLRQALIYSRQARCNPSAFSFPVVSSPAPRSRCRLSHIVKS